MAIPIIVWTYVYKYVRSYVTRAFSFHWQGGFFHHKLYLAASWYDQLKCDCANIYVFGAVFVRPDSSLTFWNSPCTRTLLRNKTRSWYLAWKYREFNVNYSSRKIVANIVKLNWTEGFRQYFNKQVLLLYFRGWVYHRFPNRNELT